MERLDGNLFGARSLSNNNLHHHGNVVAGNDVKSVLANKKSSFQNVVAVDENLIDGGLVTLKIHI